MAFKDRLKQAREAKGYTQGQLAKLLGVTKSAVSNYESGSNHVKEQILYKIFDVLEVDPNYLWQDEMAEVNSNALKQFPATKQEEKLIQKYRLLNEDGKSKLEAYLDDIVINPAYVIDNGEPFLAIARHKPGKGKSSIEVITDPVLKAKIRKAFVEIDEDDYDF